MAQFFSWVWWVLTGLLWIGFWLLVIGLIIAFLIRIGEMIGEDVLPPAAKALRTGIEGAALFVRMIVGDIAAAIARWWRQLCAEFVKDVWEPMREYTPNLHAFFDRFRERWQSEYGARQQQEQQREEEDEQEQARSRANPGSASDYAQALELLGIQPQDDFKTARKRYIAMVERAAPEHGGSSRMLQQINAAWELIRERRGWRK